MPAMDLKFHLRDVFIKFLHFWIDSNHFFGINLCLYNLTGYLLLDFPYFPVRKTMLVIFFC